MAPMSNDDEDDLSRHYQNYQRDNSYIKQCNNNDNAFKILNIKNQLAKCQEKPNLSEADKNQKDVPTIKSKILNLNQKLVKTYGTTKTVTNAHQAELNYNAGSRHNNMHDDDPERNNQDHIGVADIIGSFGWFQLFVLVFSGLREGLVGYDALIMSIILQPESEFLCADNLLGSSTADLHIQKPSTLGLSHMNLANFSALFPDGRFSDGQLNETAQCYRSLDNGQTLIINSKTHQPVKCESWIFSNETIDITGPSLVAEWSLVCQYHWLVAFIESAYFLGLVAGNLVWGYYADKVGRRPAYLAAHTISLIFGSLAVVAPTIQTFAICRFLSAFGSIGYNIIYTIQVELIGVKHRSFSTIMNHLGWGLGVICVPLLDHLFDDYRPIIAVAPVLTLLMFPWAFWLPESSRWLMANGKYKDARRELIRAARFNGKAIDSQLDKKISILIQKSRIDKLEQQESNGRKLIIGNDDYQAKNMSSVKTNIKAQQEQQTPVCSYRLIFSDRKLLRDTLILCYISLAGHLFYYVQTINFAYVKNLSTTANFITSGAGEWVSVVVGAILLKLFSRKTCMSIFLFVMTCSFGFQSFIDSGIMPELDTTITITANNGIGTLAALLLVFVVLIVNQEVYPTVVRQTGTSITNTLGESGSTLAPLIIQLSRLIGSWRANTIYSIFCLFGILASQFVTKTDDIELPDR